MSGYDAPTVVLSSGPVRVDVTEPDPAPDTAVVEVNNPEHHAE